MSTPPLVVGLGEALFDCFGDRMVLGGAPVNFAVHAHQLLAPLGGRGAVVSRVGRDDLGDDLVRQLGRWGLDTHHIQRDPLHQTGRVAVQLDGHGQPDYVIAHDAAWDHLAYTPELAALARRCTAVCFGTLAQRHAVAAATIDGFLRDARDAVRLFDVNLRQRFYGRETLARGLSLCSAAKLSQAELPIVCHALGLEPVEHAQSPASQAGLLIGRFDLDLVAVTRGARGTVLYTPDEVVERPPAHYPMQPDADSVGAGDACDAGLVAGLLLQLPLDEVLALANACGAFVASRSGATPRLPSELVAQVTRPTPSRVTS